MDILNTELCFDYSQASASRYSYLSPPDLSQTVSTPRKSSPLAGIEWPSSSRSGTYRLPSDLGQKDSPFALRGEEFDPTSDFNMFPDFPNDAMPIALNFDEFGNLVGIDENELELPALPQVSTSQPTAAQNAVSASNTQAEDVLLGEDDAVLIPEEPLLPDAEAFGTNQPPTSGKPRASEVSHATAKNKRAPRRKAKTAIKLDEIDKISRDEFKSWTRDYIEHMEALRKQHAACSLMEARRNARAFVIGNGVANVGNPRTFGGVDHPLATCFAGNALEALLAGHDPVDVPEQQPAGRRRRSEEAFDSEDDEDVRRVKQKTADNDEAARGWRDGDGDTLMIGDDTVPEVGMEPMAAMAEQHSSSMMPWSRPGSAVPGSSVRGQESARKSAPAPSPLLGRGRLLLDIDRRSDSIGHPSDDPEINQLLGRSSTPEIPAGGLENGANNNGPAALATLDVASQDFLEYLAGRMTRNGTSNDSGALAEQSQKLWVDFDHLASPASHTKAVAAQAFLHVLSLATKNIISVQQSEGARFVPFRPIRVGMSVDLLAPREKALRSGDD